MQGAGAETLRDDELLDELDENIRPTKLETREPNEPLEDLEGAAQPRGEIGAEHLKHTEQMTTLAKQSTQRNVDNNCSLFRSYFANDKLCNCA